MIISRHNEVRNLMADLLTDVCHDMCSHAYNPILVRPSLPAAPQQNTTQLDITASGLWGERFERAFLM